MSQVNSFELFGIDVLIDENLKVWLIEVNSSPSLGLATPLDKVIKSSLIEDVIAIVDPLAFDRVALHAILLRRKHKAGPDRLSRRQGGGLLAGTAAEEREVLNTDLHAILKGAVPRPLECLPKNLGQFERIAPCTLLEQFTRMKKPHA